jgi:ABC-type glycerol-3-phosphate transport system substrate-binding protein
MRRKLISFIAGVAGLAAAGSASAHHAFSAEFDQDQPIRLEGTVTKWEWINPHSWINLDVVNDAGEV